MPPCVRYYTDRVEIPFTKNGSNQLVSLAPYVPADTKLVLLQVSNEGVGNKNANAVGQGYTDQIATVTGRDDYNTICECDDASHNVVLMGQTSDIHVYLLAAFYGDGVYANPSGVRHHVTDISQNQVWITRSVDLGGGDPDDVEAVMLVFLQTSGSYSTTWGARWYGSAVDQIFTADTVNRVAFVPVKTYSDGNNALFQTWLSVKALGGDLYTETGEFWEIGYVKKEYGFFGVEEIADEAPPSVSEWTLRAVSDQVPAKTEAIFALFYIIHFYTAQHGLRGPGSTDPVTPRTDGAGTWPRGCGRAELDEQGQFEYLCDGAVGFWVWAYTFLEQIGALLAEIEAEPVLGGSQDVEPALFLPLGYEGVAALPALAASQDAGPAVTAEEPEAEPAVTTTITLDPGAEGNG